MRRALPHRSPVGSTEAPDAYIERSKNPDERHPDWWPADLVAAIRVDALLAPSVTRRLLDGESACGYLSLHEQRQVAVSGRSTTCRDVLNDAASPPGIAGLTTPRQVRDLPARVQLAGGGATVRLGGGVFLLRPATAEEQLQFNAPPGYWRIASGVTALLPAG
ncbi:MAG: hypothetical protein ACR2H2_02745 [Solirubrobacteraceae bacterium]